MFLIYVLIITIRRLVCTIMKRTKEILHMLTIVKVLHQSISYGKVAVCCWVCTDSTSWSSFCIPLAMITTCTTRCVIETEYVVNCKCRCHGNIYYRIVVKNFVMIPLIITVQLMICTSHQHFLVMPIKTRLIIMQIQ